MTPAYDAVRALREHLDRIHNLRVKVGGWSPKLQLETIRRELEQGTLWKTEDRAAVERVLARVRAGMDAVKACDAELAAGG